MKQTVIDGDLCGLTIKRFLEESGYSTSQIKRFKYNGEISVNGKPQTVRYVLEKGDVLTLRTFSRLQSPQPARDKAKIIYADEYLYVAEKPYGVATHPDRAHKNNTFGNMLAAAFGQDFELRIITRLDKTTSGLVLGALDEITAEKLNAMQLKHEIRKEYAALVEGRVTQGGEINLPLLRLDKQNKTAVSEQGKPAVTKYRVEEIRQNCTLLRVFPLTGRTHQIRAHLSAIGHPVIGDETYGAGKADRIKLHCRSIAFVHPFTGEIVEVRSPIDF